MILPALGPVVLALSASAGPAWPPALLPLTATLPGGAAIALQTTPPPLPASSAEASPANQPTIDTSVVVLAKRPAPHAKGDPLEHFNRKMFHAQQKFDKAVLRPGALGYKHVVPKPLRSGVRHFLSNLTEPIVFLNDLLQLKPGRAIKTFGRCVFNSTLGLGGVLDVAKAPRLDLPHRPNGFGDTLGYYGVKPGPYLFLPFVGPTDLRDLLGGQADGLVLPLAIGHPFDQLRYQIPKAVVSGLDQRAEADDELKALFGSAVDPYATLRSVYLQDRAGEILQLKGKSAAVATPDDELTDPLADPAAATPDRSPAPELDDPMNDPAATPTPSPAPELGDPMADPAGSH